jgi:predicted phage terminase large subunit-like protein
MTTTHTQTQIDPAALFAAAQLQFPQVESAALRVMVDMALGQAFNPSTFIRNTANSKAQAAFLSTSADIAVYGGAAGGGKSYALLLECLRHTDNAAFGAVVFRRTFPQITREGGLWDSSMDLYSGIGAKPNQSGLVWKFESGAKVKFAHLQHEKDKLDWQGSQLPLICWDELTHFTESQFFYMLSRNRSLCGVKPYIRATCNPDADSWVAKLIEWWIDQETGIAIPERSGKIRYFVRINEQLEFADTAEELTSRFGSSIHPKSLTFIPASVYDNVDLMRTNPEYISNLMAMSLVERERLLGGNWKVRNEAGKVFNRDWFEIVDAAPAGGEDCRFWDLASTEKKLNSDDPDYTAGVKIRAVGGAYYIMAAVQRQASITDADKLMLNTASQDGKACKVRWEIEGGASGKRENLRLVQMFAGYDCGGARPEGDKITRAKGLAAQAEAGNVKLLRGDWNEEFLNHLHNQPQLSHDDLMDAASGAFNEIAGYIPPATSVQSVGMF